MNTHSRPHSVHASSSSFSSHQDNAGREHIPRGSTSGLGVLPEAAVRRLSRDDTAADFSELIPQEGFPEARSGPGRQTSDSPLVGRPEYHESTESLRTARQQRRNIFRSSSTLNADAVGFKGQTASLGRRFSKSYKERLEGFKDNMPHFLAAGKTRRASTPQGIDSSVHVPKFTGAPVPPTSPSKRNGTGIHEGERPTKLNRHFLKQTDRKDTPAPPPFGGPTRPHSRSAASAMALSMAGGERARQAAAASKNFSIFNENIWAAPDDYISRRNRLGSLSSAADSGADLSSYAASNASCKDLDGDVAMNDTMLPYLRDPLVTALPNEIGLQVFEYLDAKDLARCELVSKTWKALVAETSVWRTAFLRRYERQIYTDPAPIQVGGAGCGRPNKPNQQWKRMYKARTLLDKNWTLGPAGAGKAVYLSGHTDSVYCVQFDEEKIITGSRDRTIRVWDINNFTCKRVIGGPSVKPTLGPKVLRTVDYPDFHLATASVNGTAYGQGIYHEPVIYHDASILCLQYDEKHLVTGSSDSTLIIWDIKTYQPIKRLERHTAGVLDVALDANHIVSCSKDSRIVVWDRKTLELKGELAGHKGPVNAVQMRGKFLVSASGDGIARLWNLDTMKLVKEFSAKERGLAAVEFSEDMKYVLAGGNDTITYKFEVETGKEVKQFTGHSQLVRSLWLDSQNDRVVSGSYDLDIRVYDFTTGEQIWRAEEWTTSWMLAAKSDYRRIVATSQDGRILIIDFGLQKCRDPDDGQPIDGVDLLRGTDNSNAIEWRNPWESTRQRDRLKEEARLARLREAEEAILEEAMSS